MSQVQKTDRNQLEYRSGISEWFITTEELFNRVVAFYFNVIHAHELILNLKNQEALTILEKFTHTTQKNPKPIMPLSEVAGNIPAMFRRAAINAALGAARSFYSNLARWQKAKTKAKAKGRQFTHRPPVPPRMWKRSVTFYAGMWKERENGRIILKLWDGQTWRWVRFHFTSPDRLMGSEWVKGSPQVVCKDGRWWLHTPVTKEVPKPQKAEKQVKTNPDIRVCAIDLNINDALAVCTIQQADGTVVATRFIKGGRELHARRKGLLGKVARNRRKTGRIAENQRDNVALWRKIRAIDEDEAHRVSRRIVQFAAEYGASILVFEHLGRFKPQKGRYSKRGNEKRSYWLRGRIFRYSRYKAWEYGMLTCRVNPRDTSRLCGKRVNKEMCGGELARYGEGEAPVEYRPGAPLVYCSKCGGRRNADLNATLNIGYKFFLRYQEDSTHSEKPQLLEGAGVLRSQEQLNRAAKSGVRLHTKPERHGARNGHGTAQVAEVVQDFSTRYP